MNLLKLLKSVIPEYLKQKLRIALIRRRFPDSTIHSGAEIGFDCVLKEKVVIFRGVQISLSTLIDRYSYVQSGTVIWNAEIGPFCSIARNVTIGLAAHPTSMVSTNPVFYDNNVPLPHTFVREVYFKDAVPRTFIGADVWIGEGVKILAGVSIGNGSIIGAGSIVTKDIPQYSIAVGSPCKPIRKRFPDHIEKKIALSAWWEWSDEYLLENAMLFHKTKNFVEMMKQKKRDKSK